MPSLRQRNRLNAMRLTQRTALAMFQEHGFQGVTVDEIAAEVGMAASTIYRHFETKEDLVLWDEHDAAIDKALEQAFKQQPPLAAIRSVFVDVLGTRYDTDLEFQLGRIKYIYATEALHAAAVEADLRARDELAVGVAHFMTKKNRAAAPVLAGAAMVALDVALDRWQQCDAARTLGALIGEAFDQLAVIDTLR